jgi:hypothetical protein
VIRGPGWCVPLRLRCDEHRTWRETHHAHRDASQHDTRDSATTACIGRDERGWQRSREVADILPTSYEVGVLNGHVAPGEVNGSRSLTRARTTSSTRRSVRVFWACATERRRAVRGHSPRIACGVLQLVVDKREDAFDVCRAATESISELSW